ncbi:MAG: hypothetical protein V8T87_10900 [Victivallales bacterium]
MARNLVRTFADAGFKYLTCGSHEPDNAADPRIHERGGKTGHQGGLLELLCVAYARQVETGRVCRKSASAYPNVIALLIIDEPELYAKSDEVKAFMESYRKALPEIPVFMNNTVIGIPGHFADLATDIIMIDDYLTNSETRTVREILERGGDGGESRTFRA